MPRKKTTRKRRTAPRGTATKQKKEETQEQKDIKETKSETTKKGDSTSSQQSKTETNLDIPLEEVEPEDYVLPEVGELVIGTCTKITPHGAYVRIEDYEYLGDEAGFIHVSELSRTWVKNIRNHIREGQRIVAKVMRVHPRRREVDLSMRRVSEDVKRQKLQEYKNNRKAKNMLAYIADKNNIPQQQMMNQVIEPLIEEFGDLYSGLLEIRRRGPQILTNIGVDEKLAQSIYELTLKELQKNTVSLIGQVNMRVFEPNGIEIIKDAFAELKKKSRKDSENIDINMYVISPPRYRISIETRDWKTAEQIWKEIQDTLKAFLSKYNAKLEFVREKT